MATGIVKQVVVDRGFGFIARLNEPDVFFHVRGCDPRIVFDETITGMRVEFEVEQSERGPRAVDVRPA